MDHTICRRELSYLAPNKKNVDTKVLIIYREREKSLMEETVYMLNKYGVSSNSIALPIDDGDNPLAANSIRIEVKNLPSVKKVIFVTSDIKSTRSNALGFCEALVGIDNVLVVPILLAGISELDFSISIRYPRLQKVSGTNYLYVHYYVGIARTQLHDNRDFQQWLQKDYTGEENEIPDDDDDDEKYMRELNKFYSELHKVAEKDPILTSKPQKSEGCFIATEVYGSYDSPEVLKLRAFRDQILLRSFIGEKIVKLYYYFSPQIARQLKDRPVIKKNIKRLLDKFISL